MRGVIESANFKEEWDKTSWKIGNEFYSIKGDFSHMQGKEVIFDVYTVPKSGGKHVSGAAFTVANENPEVVDPDPSDLQSPQAQGNGQVQVRTNDSKDKQIVYCVVLKSILNPWVSPDDDHDRVEWKALEASRIAKIVSSPNVKKLSSREDKIETYNDEPAF